MKVTSENVPQQFKPFTIKIEIENEIDLAYVYGMFNCAQSIVIKHVPKTMPEVPCDYSFLKQYRQLKDIIKQRTDWISN